MEKYRIGNVEVAVAVDMEGAVETTRFFPAVPPEAWQPYRHLLTGSGRMRLRVQSFVLRSQGRTILVDTGVGHWDLPGYGNGRLLESLAALGLQPGDIDLVLNTHLHDDHVGWNTRPSANGPVPTFERARYLFQQREWDYWTRPEALTKNRQLQVAVAPLGGSGRLDLIDAEHQVTDEVTLLHTPGHTPGHVAIVIQSAGETALLVGDACHHPAQLTEVGWTHYIDTDPAESVRTREKIAARAVEWDALVSGAHFNAPVFGRLFPVEGRRTWQAVALPSA